MTSTITLISHNAHSSVSASRGRLRPKVTPSSWFTVRVQYADVDPIFYFQLLLCYKHVFIRPYLWDVVFGHNGRPYRINYKNSQYRTRLYGDVSKHRVGTEGTEVGPWFTTFERVVVKSSYSLGGLGPAR